MNRSSPAQFLQRLGVDVGSPGFYNEPEFLRAENSDPTVLEEYAGFIAEREYDADYLVRAKSVIEIASTFLREKLASDGALGKCIDASMVLMLFLERQGIWCYANAGALTLRFERRTKLGIRYFAPLMAQGNIASDGHVWLCAPPFQVVDVTVSLQPYTGQESRYLPNLVLASCVEPYEFVAEDLMEPDLVGSFFRSHRRNPTLEDAFRIAPQLYSFCERFPAIATSSESCRLCYVPVRITAPQESLEEWANLILGGKGPMELYAEFLEVLKSQE